MRTSDALERLAAVGPPLLADTVSLVDEAEENRILERILRSERAQARSRTSRRLRPALLAAAALVVATIAAAVGVFTSKSAAPPSSGPHRHLALTGARIQLAGYHFKTPAGFKTASNAACRGSGPNPAVNGFVAAASAEGGCVGASFLIGSGPGGLTATPAGQAVDVGSYQGYYEAQGDSRESTLFVELPKADPSAHGPVYLALFAQDLTKDELIAVARSGLPSLPLGPSTTTGTEANG